MTKNKPLMVQPGVSIERDPVKNKAADKVIDIYMNGPWDKSDDSDHGIPRALVQEAGRALANRYCFAVCSNEGYGMTVLITPIKHFEKDGACDDQDGPIRHLLPPRVGNSQEATWEFYDEAIKTPMDAAKELQKYGFFWNRGFQDFIDPSLTEELSSLEQPIVKVICPMPPKHKNPKL